MMTDTTTDRDKVAAEIHELYLRMARALGWPVSKEHQEPFDKLPKDLQTLNRAIADYHLERIEATKKAERANGAAQTIASKPEMIADILLSLAEAIRPRKETGSGT